jgi:hypothetical protein
MDISRNSVLNSFLKKETTPYSSEGFDRDFIPGEKWKRGALTGGFGWAVRNRGNNLSRLRILLLEKRKALS